MEEIWKDVPNYEGIYQVSNLGRVKSLGNDKKRREKILKGCVDSAGYKHVILCNGKFNKLFKIHSLVAIAFLNHKPDGTTKIVVDHIDNNTLNNKLNNLQLITHRENLSKDKKGLSKYVGVCWNKHSKSWKSYITINSKCYCLGYFKNEYDAHLAYQNKLKEISSL